MVDIEKFEDAFSNIERYYKNQGRLSKREQELCERWELAFALLRAQKNKVVAQKKYKALMLSKGVILSESDIVRDFRHSIQLFAPISLYTKDFLRMVITESAMKRIDLQQRKARKSFESNNLSDYEKMIKLIQKDEEIIMKINALDSSDPDMPDFSKVEMTQINVQISSDNSKIFEKILGKGSFDMNEFEDANEVE